MATVSWSRSNGDGLASSPRKKTPTSKFINSLDSPDRTPATTATTPSPSSSLLQGEFYAIRKGKGVKHCIFASWDHAKEHVHNYKDAVYNVFDKMEDALSYIRLPSITKNAANQKRKRTAMLPCSSSSISNNTVPTNTVNYKKPRTVSITHAPAPMMTVSVGDGSNKENDTVAIRPAPAAAKVPPAAAVEVRDGAAVEDGRSLPKILEEGYKNAYQKGWRANNLFPQKKQCRDKWEKRYLQDVAELKEFRQNQSKTSAVRDVHKMNHCSGIPNAFSLAYLNWSWGVGEAYHRYLAFQQRKQKPAGANRQRMKNNKLKATPANRSNHYSCSTCVITNREAARKRFTSKAMFYSFRVQQYAEMSTTNLPKDQLATRPAPNEMHNQSPLVNGCSRSKEWMDEARADWETLAPEDKAYWEEQARLHDERQPEILKILEESLRRDPKRSAKKLSEDISYWCGKTTIGKWKNLRIGPSYRKGSVNPISRDEQQAHMNDTAAGREVLGAVSNTTAIGSQVGQPQSRSLHAVLPQVSEPSETTEDPYSGDEYDAPVEEPHPSECLSSTKKAEMEAHMAEEDLVI